MLIADWVASLQTHNYQRKVECFFNICKTPLNMNVSHMFVYFDLTYNYLAGWNVMSLFDLIGRIICLLKNWNQ